MKGLKGISPYLGALLLSLWGGLLGPLSRDGDLYFHLRWGNDVLARWSLPRTDTLTYSAFGAPSELHSWLGSTVLALIYRMQVTTALYVLHTFLILALLVLVIRYLEREKAGAFWCSIGVAAVFLVYSEIDDLRPFAFAALFLMWGALELPRRLNAEGISFFKKAALVGGWAVLWANFHGTGLLAPLLVFALAGSHRVRWATIALLATLCTPQGIFAYPSALLLSKTAMAYRVSEWMPPQLWNWQSQAVEFYLSVSFAAVVFLLAFVTTGILRPTKEKVIGLIVVILYLTSRRHLIFLLPVLVWAIPQTLGFRWHRLNEGLFLPLSQGVVLFLVVVIHGFGWRHTIPMPTEAVEFLKAAGIRGNIMAHQPWGGFVAWQMPTDAKIGIDCRITVHEEMAKRFQQSLSPDGTVDLGKVVTSLPETDIVLYPSEVALRSLFRKTGTIVYESPVATVVILNTTRNTENRIKVEEYYRSRGIPFSFLRGFDVGLAMERPWWAEQSRFRHPQWDGRGRAEEVVSTIDFYRVRGLSRWALEVAKRAVDDGNVERPVLFKLGELLLENGDIAAGRQWLTFLERKFGPEATLPLHRTLVRVDPLALR